MFRTVAQNVQMKHLDRNASKFMEDALRERNDYRFITNSFLRVPRSMLDPNCEIQPLQWVFETKRTLKVS